MVEVDFLGRLRRGATGAETVKIQPDRPVVYLGIELDPADVATAEQYRFAIRSGRKVVWSLEVSGEQIRRNLVSPQGAVILSVSTAQLKPGTYELAIENASSAAGEALARKRITIVR